MFIKNIDWRLFEYYKVDGHFFSNIHIIYLYSTKFIWLYYVCLKYGWKYDMNIRSVLGVLHCSIFYDIYTHETQGIKLLLY